MLSVTLPQAPVRVELAQMDSHLEITTNNKMIMEMSRLLAENVLVLKDNKVTKADEALPGEVCLSS